MSKLVNLVKNENMKIYRRVRTWVLVGLLIGLVVAVSLISYSVSKNMPDLDDQDWRTNLQNQVENDRNVLEHVEDLPEDTRARIQRQLLINEYRLEHDIPPNGSSLWNSVQELSSLIFLVTVSTIVIAADIVASEFATGTIKMLLIRPASRSKILLSKYVATLLFSLLLLAVLFVTSFVMSGILYGFSSASLPHLYVTSDLVVKESPMFLQVLKTYGLSCVQLIMLVTMAFMISSVFRSSSLAIGLSLMLLLMGDLFTVLFARWEWGKYWLFANTNLMQYLDGNTPMIEGMTLPFSITVLAVYYVLFMALSWTMFVKRDVAS